MSDNTHENDPMAFLRSLWGGAGVPLPGLVTPTLDIGELDKRISDLKAVEGWLKLNLGMLQMSVQGLELQRNMLLAVQAAGSQHPQEGSTPSNPFTNPALWPWGLMSGANVQNSQRANDPPDQKTSPPES
jgi:hypothetical protein